MFTRGRFPAFLIHCPCLAGAAVLWFATAAKVADGQASGLLGTLLLGIELTGAIGLSAFSALAYVRVAGCGLFFVLGLAAGHKFAIGATDCGCFGTRQVSPASTFALDAILASLLGASAWLHPLAGTRGATLARGVGIAGGFVAIALALQQPLSATVGSRFIGTRWGELGVALVDSDLSRGEWIVVLHRSDCPSCSHVVSQWRKWQELWRIEQREERIAFVDVASDPDAIANSPLLGGKGGVLPPSIPVPTVLHLRQGRIVDTE